jgi:hypothetical protein
MTAKKKQTTGTEQQIKNETSTPKRVREILARCPVNELKPIRLTKWVDELYTASREEGISDRQIKQWIIDYAENNYWHRAQINSILIDYGLTSGGGGGGGTSDWNSRGEIGIQDITRIIEKMTGLDDLELLKADSKDELEKKSRTYMVDLRSRMNEFDLNNLIGEVQRLKTVIDIFLDSLREQKRVLRNSALTQ